MEDYSVKQIKDYHKKLLSEGKTHDEAMYIMRNKMIIPEEPKKERKFKGSSYQSKKPVSRKLKEKASELKKEYVPKAKSLMQTIKERATEYVQDRPRKKQKPQKEKYHRKPESKKLLVKPDLATQLGNVDKKHESGKISTRQHDMETRELIAKHDKKLLEINAMSSSSSTKSMQKRMRKLSH